MTVEKLMEVLSKMVSLHGSLLKLETMKTDCLKRGDIDALTLMLNDENKHVLAINKLEAERKLLVVKMISGYPLEKEEPSLVDVMKYLPHTKSEALLSKREQLSNLLTELKKVNQLNQELIHSSLQFVTSSLDLLMPQPQTINYNKPTNKGQTEHVKRSMFDSKA